MGWPKRRGKYGNKKVQADGHTFDSKAEHARYCELKLLERAGEIEELVLQPRFTIHDAYKHPVTGKRIRAIEYVADFQYTDTSTGALVVEDVKGGSATQTKEFKIKRKMFERRYNMGLTVVER